MSARLFGMVGTQLGGWAYACLEDSGGDHVAETLVGSLYCSTSATCPSAHLTQMDQLGVACAPAGSRRSICPCE